jgi:hypothetical protein
MPISHENTFVAALLAAPRVASVVTSFRVVATSSADAMLADSLLRAGVSAGELTLALNELKGGALPAFLCLGDPEVRAATPRGNDAPGWRDVVAEAQRLEQRQAVNRRQAPRWSTLRRAALRLEVQARPEAATPLSTGLASTFRSEHDEGTVAELARVLEEPSFAAPLGLEPGPAGEHRPTPAGISACLSAMVLSFESFRDESARGAHAAVALGFAREIDRTCSYIHELWRPFTELAGERDRGLHACGTALHSVEYRNLVFRGCDFSMWVCARCGVVGYSMQREHLPAVRELSGGRFVLSELAERGTTITACVEPLREARAPLVGPLQSDAGSLELDLPTTASPGLNWVAVVGVSDDDFFCLRVPVMRTRVDEGWSLAWRLLDDARVRSEHPRVAAERQLAPTLV